MHREMTAKIMPMIMKSSHRSHFDREIGGSQQAKQSRPPKTLTRLVARRDWFALENVLTSNRIHVDIDEKGIITEESILQFVSVIDVS